MYLLLHQFVSTDSSYPSMIQHDICQYKLRFSLATCNLTVSLSLTHSLSCLWHNVKVTQQLWPAADQLQLQPQPQPNCTFEPLVQHSVDNANGCWLSCMHHAPRSTLSSLQSFVLLASHFTYHSVKVEREQRVEDGDGRVEHA